MDPLVDEARLAIDAHTIALLFALMVISAQFRLGGFLRRNGQTDRGTHGCTRRASAPGRHCGESTAATLIGNPQNMFIGESLRLPFGGYVLDGAPPAALGLAITWFVIRL